MQRFTISLDDDIAHEFDHLMQKRGYSNRSEAVRDMLRRELSEQLQTDESGRCTAVVSYAFDHHKRQLSEKMVGHQHAHSSLVISTMHVHINPDCCVETVVMRGETAEVLSFAKDTIAQTGIEHGAVHVIPETSTVDHTHAHGQVQDHDHGHAHSHDHGHEH